MDLNSPPVNSPDLKDRANADRTVLYTTVLSWTMNALVAGLLLLAFVSFALRLTSDGYGKALFDSVAAVPSGDGTVTHPTEGGLKALIERLPFVSAVLSFLAISLVIFRSRLAKFLLAVPPEWSRISRGFLKLWPPGEEKRLEIASISIILCLGIFLRARHLRRPIHFDEATTYLNYACSPLYRALSNYSYPNNHLFNTLLAHFSIGLFGHTTFALRLPAFIAGCLAIPASWLASRLLYNRTSAILTAACVAAMPTFIEYSVNARGYTLQWLSILTMMSCSAILCKNPSLNTGWLLLVVAAVAGAYCVPSMLIPATAILLWMLVCGFAARDTQLRSELSRKVLCAVFAMVLLSLTLYLPPILASGPAAIFSNRFVASGSVPFLEGLPPLAEATWVRWVDGVPAIIVWALVGGIITGLFWHRNVSTQFVPISVIIVLWSFAFAWIRNIIGYPRVWSYLLLAAVMMASSGWSVIVGRLANGNHLRQTAIAGAGSILLVLAVGADTVRHRVLFRSNETMCLPDIRDLVGFLRTQLRPGTALFVGPPAAPIVTYELLHADKPLFMSLPDLANADRVIIVVPKFEVSDETHSANEHFARLLAESVVPLPEEMPDINLRDYEQSASVANFLSVTVYSVQKRPEGSFASPARF